MNFILTTYNRPDYLEKCLASLASSPFTKEDTLWIFDDFSSNPKTVNLINNFKITKAKDIHLFQSKENTGCDTNSFMALNFVYHKTKDPYIFMTETDGVYLPGWLDFLRSCYSKATSKSDIGVISLFNTKSHEIISNYDNELNEKKTLGGFASLVNCEYLREVNYNKDPFNWDWELFKLLKDKNKKLLCSEKTYAQHIGAFGTHSKGFGHDTGINEVTN